MNKTTGMYSLLILLLSASAYAEEEAEGPRTGFFRVSMTPTELMGPDAAVAIAGILPRDGEIVWGVRVPLDCSI